MAENSIRPARWGSPPWAVDERGTARSWLNAEKTFRPFPRGQMTKLAKVIDNTRSGVKPPRPLGVDGVRLWEE